MICSECKLKIEKFGDCLECGIRNHMCPGYVYTQEVKHCRYHQAIFLITRTVKPREICDKLLELLERETE